MTARPFSRLEPVSNPDDPARLIATFFSVIGCVAALPAALYTLMLCAITLGLMIDVEPGVAFALLALAYAIHGFRQLGFYLRRASQRYVQNARRWWLSTYAYNLVPLALSLGVFIDELHIGPAIAVAWFATLCTLAIVAYGADHPHHNSR